MAAIGRERPSGTLVHFPKDGTLVRPSAVIRYVRWNLGRSPGPVAKVRRVAAMLLSGRIGTAAVDPDHLARLRLFRGVSWMRYATDGAGLQVIDAKRRIVTKVSLRPDVAQMERQVRLRARLGEATPPILAFDADAGLLIEAWIPLRPAPDELDTLKQAIALLRDRLYEPVPVETGTYLRSFADVIEVAQVCAFLRDRGLERLLVTSVHGDLWPGNLGLDASGRLILMDWEYARTCVQSHDLWIYLFQRRLAQGMAYDRSFLQTFAGCLEETFSGSCSLDQASGLHLLHLIERYALFKSLDLSHKDGELRHLEREIARMLQA